MNRSAARSISRLIGGSAPKSATPPNFNRPKQIAMVVRQLASAIGRQKFRAEVFRQRHPVLPTCTHAASWSRCPAANALTQVPLIEPSFVSNRKLAHMAGCCGSRDGEQPPTSAHPRRGPPHGGELRQAAGTDRTGRTANALMRPTAQPTLRTRNTDWGMDG
jgi:hypothetical protein